MAAEAIDWAAAVRAGQRMAPTGPQVSAEQARQAVDDLQQFSAKAELIVRDTTGLGHGLPVEAARVVDRPHWIEATAKGMAELTAPLAEKLIGRLGRAPRAKTLAGAQLGVVLSFLSSRVLGQYDPLSMAGPDAAGPGVLLLVAPNIIKVERELHVDPVDFRMWVCLHESTHRLQFTAVPWLREHFRSLVAEFGSAIDTDPSEMLGRMVGAIKGRTEGSSWIETIQSPEQRAVFDQLMALMTLLEGHADHVMDAVGPAVIPSVGEIRSAFTLRRKKGRGPFDRLLRSLLGMDMKMAQYVKGAAFVRTVVERAGMDAFNTIWSSPDTLPTRAETTEPESWMRRVLT
ncbi:putative hydrolase/uncharacterized protein, coenzyme F420 biosynthesis associated [Nakamurella panacisegetis]|uniref:Putative hydrolase/uncharacterized protein, coenzyme F420 biosynthesis associated n=1 Tax=Nakamurella panacisegetis TaxID=1090615 RepID=A0A1H0NNE3_9ACTN|nr:zinc-dependent metalloprotease [Nakamurella panacisegetis]SDO94199.1 putative hydrolase/uncharacterized protein, coenzyme F420 biosynthesis associated [Nakamurella panacisegetis]